MATAAVASGAEIDVVRLPDAPEPEAQEDVAGVLDELEDVIPATTDNEADWIEFGSGGFLRRWRMFNMGWCVPQMLDGSPSMPDWTVFLAALKLPLFCCSWSLWMVSVIASTTEPVKRLGCVLCVCGQLRIQPCGLRALPRAQVGARLGVEYGHRWPAWGTNRGRPPARRILNDWWAWIKPRSGEGVHRVGAAAGRNRADRFVGPCDHGWHDSRLPRRDSSRRWCCRSAHTPGTAATGVILAAGFCSVRGRLHCACASLG